MTRRTAQAATNPFVCLVTPHALLHRAPPHALHEGALDLADIDHRVQRAAQVHQHVGTLHNNTRTATRSCCESRGNNLAAESDSSPRPTHQDVEVASEGIDLHLGHRDAVGEVAERRAALRRVWLVEVIASLSPRAQSQRAALVRSARAHGVSTTVSVRWASRRSPARTG